MPPLEKTASFSSSVRSAFRELKAADKKRKKRLLILREGESECLALEEGEKTEEGEKVKIPSLSHFVPPLGNFRPSCRSPFPTWA